MRIFLDGRASAKWHRRSAARAWPAVTQFDSPAARTADLIDRTMLAAAVSGFRPDLVVNAAAYTAVDKAEDEADMPFVSTVTGPQNAAAGAAAARAPLIHLSTDYVYDGAKPSPYVETDAPLPIGVYGASKLAGEAAIAAMAASPHPAHRLGLQSRRQ